MLLAFPAGGGKVFGYTEQEIRSAGVELRASLSGSSPRITLHWNASPFSVSGQIVYRRKPGDGTWELSVSVSPTAVSPDGHWDPPPLAHHRGAWPTDAFYGDMDGIWTDSSVHYTQANVDGARNDNVAGDGKFDFSLLTGAHLPELAVGRIDFANLSGFAGGLSETDLLRQYLDRLHEFRLRQGSFAALGERALVDDDTFGPQWGFPSSVSGWTSGVALFGYSNTAAGDWIPALRDQDCLVAYGCGPGAFSGAGGVSSVGDFRDTRCRAVFNLLFGSFFGDWDSNDNYLRAPLAGRADSRGLVSVWSGVPVWRLFPLAAGGTMVDAYRHVVHEVNQPG